MDNDDRNRIFVINLRHLLEVYRVDFEHAMALLESDDYWWDYKEDDSDG